MKIWKKLFGDSNDKIHVDEIAVAPGLLLGGAVIIESGTNAAGSWIKFGDGTMICHIQKRMNTTCDAVVGSLFRNTPEQWIFPKPFASTPSVSTQVLFDISFSFGSIGNAGANALQYNYCVLCPTKANNNPIVSLIAIGRWK